MKWSFVAATACRRWTAVWGVFCGFAVPNFWPRALCRVEDFSARVPARPARLAGVKMALRRRAQLACRKTLANSTES